MMRSIAVACGACLMAATLSAAEPDRIPAEPLRYFRLLVSEKLLDDKPAIAAGFSPYPREEFWKLIESAQTLSGGSLEEAGPRITQATYRARWSREQGLKGEEARLEITAGSNSPSLMPLEPLSLAVGTATWDEEPPRPALMGLSPQGKTSVMVDKSSTLTFPWWLRGKQGSAEHSFELALPTAAAQKLLLELPSALRPIVPGAIIEQQASQAGANFITWQIELGQQTPALLTLINSQDPASQPLVLVRESNAANLSVAGLDLSTTFTLDIHHQPLSKLELSAPAGLDISAVRVGDKSLPFKVLTGATNSQRIVVELAEPLLGVLRVVNLHAIAPWQPGKSYSLPRFSLEGGVWQEGSATLSLGSTLELVRLAMTGGRLTGVTAAAANSGESYQLQFFSAQATAELHAQEISTFLQVDSLAGVQLDPSQVSGVFSAHVTASRGETFDLQLDVSREWLVDSLETTPPDVIDERTFTQAPDGRQTAELRLKQAIREGQDLRLLVRARRRGAALDEEFGPDQFRFLRLIGNVSERRTLVVGTADSAYVMRAIGDAGLRRIAVSELPPSELSALGRVDEHLAFVDDESANSLRLKLQTEEPNFSAAIKVQTTVAGDQVEEVFRLRLQPQGTALNEVLVRLGMPTRAPLVWQFEDSEEPVTAQRIEDPTDAGPDPGEMWRLRWKRGRAESFVLIARARLSFAGSHTVNWLSAPAAASQTGVLEIGAENGELLEIDAPELDPAPPPMPAAGQISTARAAYRYDPSRRVQATITREKASALQPVLLVKSLHVDSTFQLDGRARHEAVARIENLGADDIQVALRNVEGPIEWMVNGRQVAALPVVSAAGAWNIALPEGAAEATLQLIYSTPAQPMGWLGRRSWEINLPEFNARVLSSISQTRLPPGVRVSATDARPGTLAQVFRRLVGPFWRNSNYSFQSEQGALNDWSVHEVETANSMVMLPVLYRPVVDTWGWSMVFVAMACWLILRPDSLQWMALLAAALAVLALLVPESWAPWVTGGLLGTLAAMVIRGLAQQFAAPPSAARRGIIVSASTIASCLALAIYLGQGPGFAWAQPAGANGKIAAQAARRIIVPTDEEGKARPYVYVQPEFHEQLRRITTASSRATASWLVRSAEYRLDFQDVQSNGKKRLEGLTMTFQLESFTPAVTFVLPLSRETVHLFPDGVRVNRSAVGADWSDDEHGLQIPLPGVGAHVVEVRLQPVVKAEAGFELLNLRTLPVASAQLVVAGSPPGDLELVKSPGSLSATSGGTLFARLGPVQALQLRWPEMTDDVAATSTEANQLLWWKIRPGGVTAEARFRLRPLGGKLRELRFRLDPRMRVIAWDCDQEIAWQRQIPEEEQWRLALRRPADKEVTLRAQFLLTGTTGIGNLVLPHADIIAERVPQAWVAFSTAPGLTLDLDSSLQQNRVPPADFLTDWGGADTAPQEACRIVQNGTSRSVVIRPQSGQTRYQSRYLGSLGQGHVAVRWEATLLETSSDLFEIPITIPPTARIARVSLLQSATTTSIRPTQDKPGQIVAHLSQPASAGAVIAVDLSMPWAIGAHNPLPSVSLESAKEEASSWSVYRQPSVLAQINVPKGWTAEESPLPGAFDPVHGRLLGIWRRTGEMATGPFTCQTSENEPQAVGRLVTSVQRVPAGWQAELRGDLEITGGQIDQLRLDVPTEWSGPFEAVPAQQATVGESSLAGRRILTLKPPQSLSGEWKFSLRGPLTASMGEGMRAPDVLLLDVGEVERIVVLPIRWEQQRVEWQTSGLQATEMPADWGTLTGGSANWEAFRAIATRFRATVKQVERFSGEPVIHLAEHRVSWNEHGVLTGVSSFNIEPGGTGKVTLKVPNDLELVQVRLGPHPARLRPGLIGDWTIELNSDQWPQDLKAVYQTANPERAGKVVPNFDRVEAPELVGLRVENTLWSLETPDQQIHRISSLPGVSSRGKQSLVRLEALIESARVIAEIGLTGESAESLIEAWASWRRQWTAQRQLANSLPAGEKDAFFQAKLKALDDDFERLLPQLPAGALAQEEPAQPLAELDPLPNRLASKSVTYLSVPGELPVIVLPTPRQGAGDGFGWLLVGLFAACLIALNLLLRRAVVQGWLVRWSHFAVAVLGLLWLMFLQPAWLGALLLIWAWWLASRSWPEAQRLPFDRRQVLLSSQAGQRMGN